MSTTFDWEKFGGKSLSNKREEILPEKEISQPKEKSDSFNWEQFGGKTESSEKKSSKFPDTFEEFLKSKPPKARDIRADLLTTGTAFAGLPGDIVSIFTGENPLTSESLREKSFELFPSLAPKDEKEKAWDEGLSMAMGLAAPTAPIEAGAKLLGKGIGKLGGNAIAKSLKGKYKELYEIGKDLGIDEKALAPFRHGKVTGWALKNLAKLGETAKKGVQFAENLAAPFYQKLDELGSKIPLNKITNRFIVKDLENIVKDIQKSPALVNESKDVIKFLQEAANNLKTNPNYTVEGLISLYKQMNKTVNWSSLKSTGKGHLVKEAKDAVMKGIYGMSPKIGKEFDAMNKLYAGFKNLAKEVKPIKLLQNAQKGGPVGYALLSLITGHDLESSLKSGFGVYFGKKAIGKISGKLLTDPKWVGLKEKAINTIKKGTTSQYAKILQAIKKKSEMENIDLQED